MKTNLVQLTIPEEDSEDPITTFSGHPLKFPAKHARFHHLWAIEAAEELEPEQKAAIDVYLANFCEPIKAVNNQVRCVGCGTELLNPQHPAFVSRGIDIDPSTQTLEGRCPSCAFPVRSRHLIYDFEGKNLLVALNFFPMCYHPVNLS